jgi:hypothetical protein
MRNPIQILPNPRPTKEEDAAGPSDPAIRTLLALDASDLQLTFIAHPLCGMGFVFIFF